MPRRRDGPGPPATTRGDPGRAPPRRRLRQQRGTGRRGGGRGRAPGPRRRPVLEGRLLVLDRPLGQVQIRIALPERRRRPGTARRRAPARRWTLLEPNGVERLVAELSLDRRGRRDGP